MYVYFVLVCFLFRLVFVYVYFTSVSQLALLVARHYIVELCSFSLCNISLASKILCHVCGMVQGILATC